MTSESPKEAIVAARMFVNLPVADLPRSKAFYAALGADNDARFTDESAACMRWSDTIHVMLLTHEKYRQFTEKAIADTRATSAALLCLMLEERGEVDPLIDRAVASGGRETRPRQDHGFMYGGAFEDPDGHVWEIGWMDLAGFDAAKAAA